RCRASPAPAPGITMIARAMRRAPAFKPAPVYRRAPRCGCNGGARHRRLAAASGVDAPGTNGTDAPRTMLAGVTYSIVARAEDGRMGVAVQTCLMGVGAICPWGRAGVGVVATQAFALPGYGPRLLDRLAAGERPADALADLLTADDLRDQR